MRGDVQLDRRELSGAVADLGVLIPIAVALIVTNGLQATAVLLPAGLLYLTVAAVYRLPIPVQPLKAFGAIAIAKGLGSDEIAAGALLMGVIFVLLGSTGLIDLAGRAFPKPLIRAVQLTVGLLLLSIAWKLVSHAPKSFEHALDPAIAIPLAICLTVAMILLRSRPVTLVLVSVGAVITLLLGGGDLALGPSGIDAPSLDYDTFVTAFTVLVIPQLPLTFANSCLATADAARRYFGERARRVRSGRLALTLGVANLLSGSISGMPVCHGAGGLTAHRSFGARTAGAPLMMGGALLVLALLLGAGLGALLTSFPLPILAALLGAAGLLHVGLLRDLEGRREWALAIGIGLLGFAWNLAPALALGLLIWWAPRLVSRLSARHSHA
ncbi:MAG: putative sulfate/molybdate transporter [Solirubrobacterales bacterium]